MTKINNGSIIYAAVGKKNGLAVKKEKKHKQKQKQNKTKQKWKTKLKQKNEKKWEKKCKL